MEIHRDKPQLALTRNPTKEDVAIKTPVRVSNPRSEDEDSPYFPCSTQELREDVDVLWDYNLPERKKGRVVRKSKKRLNLQQSPKVPLRRHPSNNNQIKQDFCKLREELRALKEEIAKPPDHEESLILSPREEASFKAGNLTQAIEELVTEEEDSIEDPFDDGMDDQLILFSQQVEEEIEKAYKGLDCDSSTSTEPKCDKMVASKTQQAIKGVQDSDIFNDSLDNLITEMSEDVFEQLTQVADLKQCKQAQPIKNSSKNIKDFPRSVSENCVKFEVAKTVTNKVEWHRTQSFENYSKAELSKDVLLEIERKHLEAKAKLQAKQKQQPISDSPLRCSPEEIEKKRLQALAKLQAKQQQELIEKKKQEALKRLEENRRKHAFSVKSSLSTRMQL